jgi:DhnA family fructose-bisphosphate aldolase class Ia
MTLRSDEGSRSGDYVNDCKWGTEREVARMSGHEIRAGRLFDANSGNSFVAAIDHGLVMGPPSGAEDAVDAIKRVLACRPDGIIISAGMLARLGSSLAHRNAPQVIVRADLWLLDGLPLSPNTIPEGVEARLRSLGEEYRVICSPEAAVALGADAIAMFLMLGAKEGRVFADNAEALAHAIIAAHGCGIPVVVETVLWGSVVEDRRDPDLLACAARMAAELGADIVKTEYTGDPATMRRVVAACPAPILVLGGPTRSAEGDLVVATREALEGGAKGVVYGRSIWQSANPGAVADALRKVIHSM